MGVSNKGPLFLLRRRLRHHLEYLATDDILLAKEDDGKELVLAELKATLAERGL
jgi:hypothetical protein